MTDPAGALAVLTTSEANLGLRSGHVEIREHDPQWARAFDVVDEQLRSAVQGLDAVVEHIGSTAVPGLAAKPILDIAIGAPAPINNQVYVRRLEATGFVFQADLGEYGGLFFIAKGQADVALAHAHVVALDDFQWRWYLGFRDALRADPVMRADYEQLKRRSAGQHPADRASYTQAKSDWVLHTARSLDGR